MILGRNSVGAKVAVNVCRTGQKKKETGAPMCHAAQSVKQLF